MRARRSAQATVRALRRLGSGRPSSFTVAADRRVNGLSRPLPTSSAQFEDGRKIQGCSEQQTPGSTAYPRMKVQRDRSMPSKRGKLEGAEGLASQDPCDMTKAGLLEAQFLAVIGTPLDYSAWKRGHRDTPGGRRSAECSARWASGNDPDQGNERAVYVALDTSTTRKRGIAYGTRVLWRRSPHSSRRCHARPRRTGKPSTGRRGSL